MKQMLLLLLLVSTVGVLGQDAEKKADPIPKELQFIGYSFTRFTTTNITPTNDLLQGQVIGRLFGANSTNTVPRTAVYAEQRFVPLFVYRPSILDGYAIFRGLFKIDYTSGDQAYGVGNNRGGAINAGQINLQTLLANVELRPADTWNVVVGLQRLFDNVRDPNVNTLQTAQTSGYKLAYWGTQAMGLSVFGNLTAATKGRLGVFQLWENEISRDDDVVLWMADLESRVTPLLEAGADFWYVYDHGKGGGGISVLGQGLNSALAEYNGAVRILLPATVNKYEANVFWLGGHAAYGRDFLASRWWFDGSVMTNFGNIDTFGTEAGSYADIFGFSVNGMAAYRYGMTANDKISGEFLFSSGDANNVQDRKLNSVITGNVYGSPVGIYSAHRALLLFPDPQVINRYYSAVHDISNMGYGVTAFFFNASKDIIPNKFTLKFGAATAISNVAPPQGGQDIGTELNIEAKYNLKVFLTLGVSAGYMKAGSFYDSPVTTVAGKRPSDPWTFFTTLSWLMF